MRKQIELKLEVGDANYVKPGEYFGTLDANNKLTAISVRQDDLTLKPLVDTPVAVETNKAATITTSPATVNPSTGKDAMAKATVTVATETKAQEVSIASLTAGDTLEITPSANKVGLTKVTISFTE